jgi:hypothetical protein
MVNKITVTITRTFTRDDDPFGMFSLFSEGGTAEHAIVELQYDVLQRDDNDDDDDNGDGGAAARVRFVEALLEDAVWEVVAG